MGEAEQVGSYAGLVTSILAVLGIIVAAVNHKRIRSNCCGHQVVISMDVENTSPTDLRIKIPQAQIPDLPASPVETGFAARAKTVMNV